MPTTKGIELLVRKDPISDEEWYSLIEARRSLIKPHLNLFSLRELGNIQCLEQEGPTFLHGLYAPFSDTPAVTGDTRFSLKTQGIFYHPWSGDQRSGYPHDEMMYIWGLTRDGLWLLVEVKFKSEAGYKGRGYERAQTVHIQESDLPTIIAKTKSKPEEIWRVLSEAIKEWTRFRGRVYHEALELMRVIEAEELMLSLVPRAEHSN